MNPKSINNNNINNSDCVATAFLLPVNFIHDNSNANMRIVRPFPIGIDSGTNFRAFKRKIIDYRNIDKYVLILLLLNNNSNENNSVSLIDSLIFLLENLRARTTTTNGSTIMETTTKNNKCDYEDKFLLLFLKYSLS